MENALMFRQSHWLLLAAIVCIGPANANEQLRNDALEFLGPLPSKWESPDDNPVSPHRIALGQRLFADPRLSATGKESCASCHDPAKFGSNGKATTRGHSWLTEPRNVPTVLNTVFNDAHTQDDELSEKRIRAGIDLDDFPSGVIERLRADTQLAAEFDTAFGAKTPITPLTLAKALEAYFSRLVTPDSPFDKFMKGDNTALSIEQQLGLAAFIDKGCMACHYGPSLGGDEYEAFNTKEGPDAEADDDRRFRVSPLRNVAETAPYFHAGHVDRLDKAVAMMLKTQLDDPGYGGDIRVITTFLKSLSAPVLAGQ
jgi:cytochrome c peroxidase